MARTAAVACIFLAPPAALPGQAQPRTPQDLKRLTIEELAQIEVSTASRRPERLSQTAAAVSILRDDDIRRLGVATLADAMRFADGVDVARSDSRTWAISTRGFNITTANKLLVLMDGRTVYSPLFSGTFWDVQDALFTDIDRIEIVRGPGGSIWGANAVNGVVNIITKDASATRGNVALLGTGTDDRLVAGARHGGALRTGGSYRVYGKYRHSTPERFASGEPAQDEIDFGQGGFRLESRPEGRSRWFVQGDLYKGSEGQPAIEADAQVTGANVLGRWTQSVGTSGRFQAQAYYDRTTRTVPAQFDETRHTFEFDTQHSVRLGQRHDVIAGGAFRVTHAKDTGSEGLFFVPEKRTDGLFSIFVQDEIGLHGDSTFLTLGSKFERNNLTGLEVQPTVRLRWSQGERETLWAAVSRAVRLPTRFDTDLRIVTPALAIAGSEAFESEEVVAYEAGYRAVPHPRLSFDVAMFVNRYDDLRSLELPLTPGNPTVLQNMLNAVTSGTEVTATLQANPRLRLHGAYAFLYKNLSLDEGSRDLTGGTPEGNDPSHRLTLRTHVDLSRAFELDGMFRYMGERPSPAVPAYAELDLRLGWNATPALELSLIGQNLLNERRREFGAEAPTRVVFGRGVYARSIWRF